MTNTEKINHTTKAGWKIIVEPITIHRIGEIESAVEYEIISPEGISIKSVSEMDEKMPDDDYDELDDFRIAIAKSETPDGKLKLNSYMVGAFPELVKKGSVYNTVNAWERAGL